jgi:hypothetical protein
MHSTRRVVWFATIYQWLSMSFLLPRFNIGHSEDVHFNQEKHLSKFYRVMKTSVNFARSDLVGSGQ